MKIYQPIGVDVVITEVNDGVLLAHIQCAGTSLSTASQAPGASAANLSKAIIVATYVDASNFGLVLPSFGGALLEDVEIYAMGPDGVSITVFLPGSTALVDGSVSIDIPTGTGKTLRVIGGNPFARIIGVMG